ncbi:tryptophan 2,3-dioxygenase [Actinomadura flavalba]|uniref:tryptophan 2,3-dioxygenase n=1 Tax=Actinomadura flavalba TaxID=1120938 RepID=UPI00036A34AF|nr:tryptophan 2,3-dioxygenase family protein [Actinomadura flavalba]
MKIESPTAAERSAIFSWFEGYLTQEHEALGRGNAVCPFVEPAIAAGTVVIELARLEDGDGLAELCAVMRRQTERFAALDRPAGKEGLSTLVTVVGGLPEHRFPLLDEAHRRVKGEVVRRGLMIGQFHPRCPEPATGDPRFRVAQSPVPLFAVRAMAMHDILFLHSNRATFQVYDERFGDHYKDGSKHVDERFRELYDKARDRKSKTSPYIDYQSIDVLLSLQNPRTDHPAEMTFYLAGQVMELLFKMVYEQALAARVALVEDRADQATWELRRLARALDLLTAVWDVLNAISPMEYNAFRGHLGHDSGIDSYMYRMVEFILGHKSEEMARRHGGVPGVSEQVYRSLHQSSVYDEAIHLLERRGVAVVPGEDALPEAWARVYRAFGPADDLFRLAEALTDVASAFHRWRAWHLLTVERMIGGKPGTGGTDGVDWLRHAAEQRFFPELWRTRTRLWSPGEDQGPTPVDRTGGP